jgi:hypothetical protein
LFTEHPRVRVVAFAAQRSVDKKIVDHSGL